MKKTMILSLCGVLGCVALYFVTVRNTPVKIGFVATLSKGAFQLGPAGLNGVKLAVEEFNGAGGINGHPVELIIEDDGDDHDKAWNAVNKVIEAGAVAIVGHMTSEMSFTTSPLVNEKQVLMLSPTSSTEMLTGKDDYFLRVYPSANVGVKKALSYAMDQHKLKRMAVIYDRSNYAFSESWKNCFIEQVKMRGEDVGAVIPFDSGQLENGFLPLVEQIAAAQVDGVLILANPHDTAMLCQQFSKLAQKPILLASEWSYSPQLKHHGGATVDDLLLVRTYMDDSNSTGTTDFIKKYSARFGEKPWFAAVHSYDAMRYLLAALQRNGDATRLKQTMINYGVYRGVQSSIKLDQNGDVDRIHYVKRLSGNKSKLVAQL